MQILSYRLEAFVAYDESSIEALFELCEQAMGYITTDEKAQFTLKSAIHELVVNSLEHGYKRSPGKISVSIKKESNHILLEIVDEGTGITPSSLSLNRQLKDIESAPQRGWGLYITDKLSENIKIIPNTPKGTIISVVVSI